jgi:hypothetical protein
MRKMIIPLTLLLVVVAATAAEARPRLGLICGFHLRQVYGIADTAFNRAREWLRFPRAPVAPGMVVVSARKGRDSAGNPGGHVVKILHPISECVAVINDSAGTYKRDICRGRLAVVDPSAGPRASAGHVRVARVQHGRRAGKAPVYSDAPRSWASTVDRARGSI